MKKKIKIGILIAALLTLTLTACGKKKEDLLTEYCDRMTQFYDRVAEIDDAINGIDPDSTDASGELLSELDQLNGLFAEMAKYEVPEEFSAIGDLPQEAAEYMDKAVTSYHSAYDGEFDEAAEYLAGEYYERANIRIRYMLSILHGENETGSDTDPEE
ncbi:MAG: hypothetical protein IK096_04905 [Lachnospiraceae bacterium]|nr:hypothetical protein [Lachnospiraceae bacterium]